MLSPIEEELIKAAKRARTRAYVPYSNFPVGSAVHTASGAIFHGCNIENGSYALTICAERVALYSALASGERTITHIALVANVIEMISPCGACRQVLCELASGAQLVMATIDGAVQRAAVQDLLPFAFKLHRRDND